MDRPRLQAPPAGVPVQERATTREVLAAVVRGGIYFLVFADLLLRHFVPPHPWKAGLAYAAGIGVVVLLESLRVRTGAHERRLRGAAVGLVVVVSAFVLAFLAAAFGLFGPN